MSSIYEGVSQIVPWSPDGNLDYEISPEPIVQWSQTPVNAFADGFGRQPNNPFVAVALKAILCGGENASRLEMGWSPWGDRLVFEQKHKSGCGNISVYPDFSMVGVEQEIALKQQWEFVSGLSLFTADVLLTTLAQILASSNGEKTLYPHLQQVFINADQILQYKGIRSRGEDRNGLVTRIGEEMERLKRLVFDLDQYPVKWEKIGIVCRGYQLLDVVNAEPYTDAGFRFERAWFVRLGQWAYHWLNHAEDRVWISKLLKELLQLDHRPQRGFERMAKKIGYALTISGGTNIRNMTVKRKVWVLLREIGELRLLEHQDKDWVGRCRKRFHKALRMLQDLKVIERVTYPDGFGPKDSNFSRSWKNHWLQSNIEILTVEAAHQLETQVPHAEHAQPPRAFRRNDIGTPSFHSHLRTLCAANGIPQKKLAEMVGAASPTLSNVLQGKYVPSQGLAESILNWEKAHRN